MGSSTTKLIKRYLAYRLKRPRPLIHAEPFTGPVVVLGSAPSATKPVGFDKTYHVLTINGSQARLPEWGRDKPDATFVHFYNIYGDTDNAKQVREILKGKSTHTLNVLRWSKDEETLRRYLEKMDYSCDHLVPSTELRRMAMHDKVMGRLNLERDNSEKFSNGITAVFYAVLSNAKSIILSGINPGSGGGHFYNNTGKKRLHGSVDQAILQELTERGTPIYTADEIVSRTTGLPLWPSNNENTQN